METRVVDDDVNDDSRAEDDTDVVERAEEEMRGRGVIMQEGGEDDLTADKVELGTVISVSEVDDGDEIDARHFAASMMQTDPCSYPTPRKRSSPSSP